MTSELFKRTYDNIANTLIATNDGLGVADAVINAETGTKVIINAVEEIGKKAINAVEETGTKAIINPDVVGGYTILGYNFGFYTLLIIALVVCVCAYFIYRYFKSKRKIVNIIKNNDNIPKINALQPPSQPQPPSQSQPQLQQQPLSLTPAKQEQEKKVEIKDDGNSSTSSSSSSSKISTYK
jgi:hypothetical protein